MTIRKEQQLYIEVSDRDELATVELFGSIDKGASWEPAPMTMADPFDPGHPELGGEYYYESDGSVADW